MVLIYLAHVPFQSLEDIHTCLWHEYVFDSGENKTRQLLDIKRSISVYLHTTVSQINVVPIYCNTMRAIYICVFPLGCTRVIGIYLKFGLVSSYPVHRLDEYIQIPLK